MAIVTAADSATGKRGMIHVSADGRPCGCGVAAFTRMREIVCNVVWRGLEIGRMTVVTLPRPAAWKRGVVECSAAIGGPIVGVVTGFARAGKILCDMIGRRLKICLVAVEAAPRSTAGQSGVIHRAGDGRPSHRVVATFAGVRIIVSNVIGRRLKFRLMTAVALTSSPVGKRGVIKRPSPAARSPIVGVVTAVASVGEILSHVIRGCLEIGLMAIEALAGSAAGKTRVFKPAPGGPRRRLMAILTRPRVAHGHVIGSPFEILPVAAVAIRWGALKIVGFGPRVATHTTDSAVNAS